MARLRLLTLLKCTLDARAFRAALEVVKGKFVNDGGEMPRLHNTHQFSERKGAGSNVGSHVDGVDDAEAAHESVSDRRKGMSKLMGKGPNAAHTHR